MVRDIFDEVAEEAPRDIFDEVAEESSSAPSSFDAYQEWNPGRAGSEQEVMGIASESDLKAREGADYIVDNLPSIVKPVPGLAAAQAAKGVGGLARQAGELFGAESLTDFGTELAASGEAAEQGAQELYPLKPGSGAEAIRGGLTSTYLQLPAMAASAPLAAAGMARSAAATALAPLVAITEGEAYDRYRNEGFSPSQASAGAGLEAIIEGSTEYLPLKRILDVASPVVKRGVVEFAEGLLKYGAGEHVGESLATLGQDLTARFMAKPDATLDESVANMESYFKRDPETGQIPAWEAFKTTQIATATQNLLMGGLGAGVGGLRNRSLSTVSPDAPLPSDGSPPSVGGPPMGGASGSSVTVPDTGIGDPSVSIDDAIVSAASVAGAEAMIEEADWDQAQRDELLQGLGGVVEETPAAEVPVAPVVENVTPPVTDRIYKTEKGAKTGRRGKGQQDTHDIVPVDGGFVIQPKEQITNEVPMREAGEQGQAEVSDVRQEPAGDERVTTKLYRGEFPYSDVDAGATGANSADLFNKGVGRGDFWTTDRGMADYWAAAGGKRSDGYIREATLKPGAKEFMLIDAEGEWGPDAEKVWKEITGFYPDFEDIMQNGIGDHAQAFRNAGYDVVHSMDLDGPETLILNRDVLIEDQKGDQTDGLQGQEEKVTAPPPPLPQASAPSEVEAEPTPAVEPAAGVESTPSPNSTGRSATEWADELYRLRAEAPRPLSKLYGAKGPTPEQKSAHDAEMKAWNKKYRNAQKNHKIALAEDNRSFRAAAGVVETTDRAEAPTVSPAVAPQEPTPTAPTEPAPAVTSGSTADPQADTARTFVEGKRKPARLFRVTDPKAAMGKYVFALDHKDVMHIIKPDGTKEKASAGVATRARLAMKEGAVEDYAPGSSRLSIGKTPFYSAVERMVQDAKQDRWGSAQELVKWLTGKVSAAEIEALDLTSIEGKPTKQAVLDHIKANTTEFEDVVLGNFEPEKVTDLTRNLRALVVRNDYLGYDTAGEAVSDLRDGRLDPKSTEWNTPAEADEAVTLVAELRKSLSQPTHFDTYTLPGAVEGSYREMFVTAPGVPETAVAKVPLSWKKSTENMLTAELPTGNMVTVFHDNGLDAELKVLTPDAVDVGEPQQFPTVEEAKAAAEGMVIAKRQNKDGSWQDGHSQYSAIKNPIVRIRYNERTGPNGERILFVEEMQGPSDTNQAKMPEWLRKRIYDIGVKRVIALAKEQGFDGIAWTTGEQQADRYDLSKSVDSVLVWDDRDSGRFYYEARKDGRVVTGDKGSPVTKEVLADTIGKELAAKAVEDIAAGRRAEYTGDALKVGGGGLKNLYDTMLPRLFAKYGKEKVGTSAVRTKARGDLDPASRKRLLDYVRENDNLGYDYASQAVNDLINEKSAATWEWNTKEQQVAVQRILDAAQTTPQPFLPITAQTPGEFARFRQGTTPTSLPASDVTAHLAPIVATWANQPTLEVVESEAGLPAAVQRDIRQARAEGRVRGVFFNGNTVYVVAANVASLREAEEVLLHEALGHYGAQQLFGKDYAQAMRQLFVALGGRSGITALAEQYGVDLTPYLDQEGNLSQDQFEQMAVDELLAHLQENNVKPSFVQRVIAAIRTALREMGFALKMSDADLLRLLGQMRDSVVKGTGGTVYVGDTRFSTNFNQRLARERIEAALKGEDNVQRELDPRQFGITPSAVPSEVQESPGEPEYQSHPLFDHPEFGDKAREFAEIASEFQDAGMAWEDIERHLRVEVEYRAMKDKTVKPFLRAMFDRMSLKQMAAEYPAWKAANEGTPGTRFSLFKSSDPDVQSRRDAAHGMDKGPGLLTRIKETIDRVISEQRHYPELETETIGPFGAKAGRPSDARTADILRRFEASRQEASTLAVAYLKRLTKGMTPEQMNNFEWRVLLDDLTNEVTRGRALPFGYTPETLETDYLEVVQLTDSDPVITAALEERRRTTRALVEQLVDKGLLPESVLDNQNYFRHMVLEYANARKWANLGSQTVRNKKRGWQKQREGSELDINTNFLEAEFEVYSQQVKELRTKETLEEIEEVNSISRQLKAKAKTTNFRNLVGGQENVDRIRELEEEAAELRAGERDSGVTQRLAEINGELDELDPTRPFKRKMAIGFSKLQKLANDGQLPRGLNAGTRDMAAAIASGEPSDRLFNYISELAGNEREDVALPARMILKAISEQDKMYRERLGAEYLEYRFEIDDRLIPEGYVEWQPVEGNVFMRQTTLPEDIVNRAIAVHWSVEELIAAGVLREGTVVGRRRRSIVIPEGVAHTLDNLRLERESAVLDSINKKLNGAWKIWTLLSPRRVIKYNLNNTSGDMDAAVAADPKILAHFADAWRGALRRADGELTAMDEDMIRRGVLDSGITINEIPDISELPLFKGLTEEKRRQTLFDALRSGDLSMLIPSNLIVRYFDNVKTLTNFREALLREAAYRRAVELLQQGKKVYWASNRAEIDAIPGLEDKAAKLSRELIGDYGNLSAHGERIRARYVPFWSWMEINAPRYHRIFKNALAEGGKYSTGARLVGVAGKKFIGTTAGVVEKVVMTQMLFALVSAFNHLVWGDDDDDLDIRQLHLIIGKDDLGRLISLRFQGAFSDALSWFGLEDYPETIKQMNDGSMDAGDLARKMVMATPNKMVNAAAPFWKLGAELITEKSFYPDITRPTIVRDRWEHAARFISMDSEYRAIAGKPSKGAVDAAERILFYVNDPREKAYNSIRSLSIKWMEDNVKNYEIPSGEPTERGNALYYYKQAVRFKDKEAADKYLARYKELGGTRQGLQTSIRNADPLAKVKKEYRRKFVESLSAADRERLETARKWYNDVYQPMR